VTGIISSCLAFTATLAFSLSDFRVCYLNVFVLMLCCQVSLQLPTLSPLSCCFVCDSRVWSEFSFIVFSPDFGIFGVFWLHPFCLFLVILCSDYLRLSSVI
jgi:hypothetical protein